MKVTVTARHAKFTRAQLRIQVGERILRTRLSRGDVNLIGGGHRR